MIWFISIGSAAGFVALMFHYWRELSETVEDYSRAWFFSWMRRGVVAPVCIWMLMNIGSLPFMPPLIREVVVLRNKGAWFEAFVVQTALAAMVIVSYWGSLTLGWFLAGLLRVARNKGDLVFAIMIWGPALLLFLWISCDICGWSGTAFGTLLWIWPLAHYCFTTVDMSVPQPTYSKAIGKLKLGKYREAEAAIIAQLENSETDFDGWMMLADLYAHQFHDLAEAEKAICDLCDDPETTPSQVSIAMHKLADWQLKLRRDPVAARRILEELCRRMPGTHLAKMAQLRINQLPSSVKELNEQEMPKTVVMPPTVEELAEKAKAALPVSQEDSLRLANQLVEELKREPNNVPVREKLARLFAERLGQVDLAIEQLELLVEMPEQPAAKTAEWLGLMAGWQIESHGESERAQKMLERLIHEFPHTPQAFEAQRRLSIMRIKPRGQKLRVVEADE